MNEKKFALRLNLQHFSEQDDQDEQKDQNAGDNNQQSDGDDQQQDANTFTQDQLDAILDKRLKRERKKWQDELDNQKKKEQMNAEERAQAEKQEAEKKAQAIQDRANNRIRETEAKAMALEMGVDPKKIKYFLKMSDVADIEVDDDGNVDERAMKGALQSVLDDMPEFKAGGTQRGGADFNGGTPTLTLDQINNMSVDEINANWEQVQKVLRQN